jgi:hypothetical protein
MEVIKKVVLPFLGLVAAFWLASYDIQMERRITQAVAPVYYDQHFVPKEGGAE